jgi:hypothetical protein
MKKSLPKKEFSPSNKPTHIKIERETFRKDVEIRTKNLPQIRNLQPKKKLSDIEQLNFILKNLDTLNSDGEIHTKNSAQSAYDNRELFRLFLQEVSSLFIAEGVGQTIINGKHGEKPYVDQKKIPFCYLERHFTINIMSIIYNKSGNLAEFLKLIFDKVEGLTKKYMVSLQPKNKISMKKVNFEALELKKIVEKEEVISLFDSAIDVYEKKKGKLKKIFGLETQVITALKFFRKYYQNLYRKAPLNKMIFRSSVIHHSKSTSSINVPNIETYVLIQSLIFLSTTNIIPGSATFSAVKLFVQKIRKHLGYKMFDRDHDVIQFIQSFEGFSLQKLSVPKIKSNGFRELLCEHSNSIKDKFKIKLHDSSTRKYFIFDGFERAIAKYENEKGIYKKIFGMETQAITGLRDFRSLLANPERLNKTSFKTTIAYNTKSKSKIKMQNHETFILIRSLIFLSLSNIRLGTATFSAIKIFVKNARQHLGYDQLKQDKDVLDFIYSFKDLCFIRNQTESEEIRRMNMKLLSSKNSAYCRKVNQDKIIKNNNDKTKMTNLNLHI